MTPARTAFLSVRPARDGDGPAVRTLLTGLLRELSGDSSRSLERFDETFARLVADPSAGGVLVARFTGGATGAVVGVLGYSCCVALRTGGEHLVVQELQVDPDLRGRGAGGALVRGLADVARARRVHRIEVGLPPRTYPGLRATWAFYQGLGFSVVGDRARLDVPAGPAGPSGRAS